MYSDNLMPEPCNTARSCCQHGPATAWLTSEWPEKNRTYAKNIYSDGSTFSVAM